MHSRLTQKPSRQKDPQLPASEHSQPIQNGDVRNIPVNAYDLVQDFVSRLLGLRGPEASILIDRYDAIAIRVGTRWFDDHFLPLALGELIDAYYKNL